MTPRRLVLVGDRAFAEIAHEYFTHDSPYDVVAFSVEREHMRSDSFRGLPVVPFESLPEAFAPAEHSVHVAITYLHLNRVRARLAREAKAKGYALASYVSSRAFVWRNAELGEHCFIFEHVTVQPFVRIGDNVVIWSGSHVGHHARIGDNCFIAHAGVSGGVDLGDNTFVGGNAGIANDITVGADCFIGGAASVFEDLPADSIVTPPRSDVRDYSARARFVPEDG